MSTKPSRELGNILRSVPAATALEDTAAAIQPTERNAPAAQPGPVPPRVEKVSLPQDSSTATLVDLEVPLQVTVPKRVRKDLLVMAADQDCSVRALILRAILTLGIEVAEGELRDKRRKS